MTELCFGFVPQGVLSDLVDVGNWKKRAQAVDALHASFVQLGNKAAVLPQLPALLDFVLQLLGDHNFRVALSGLQLLQEVGASLPDSLTPHLRMLVPALVTKLFDSHQAVRDGAQLALAAAMSEEALGQLVDMLAPLIDGDSNGVPNNVKELVINTLIMALLSKGPGSCDPVRLIKVLLPAISCADTRLSSVAMEALACLHQQQGPAALQQQLRAAGGSELLIATVLQANIQNFVPSLNAAGLVLHKLVPQNNPQEINPMDRGSLEGWLEEGPGSPAAAAVAASLLGGSGRSGLSSAAGGGASAAGQLSWGLKSLRQSGSFKSGSQGPGSLSYNGSAAGGSGSGSGAAAGADTGGGLRDIGSSSLKAKWADLSSPGMRDSCDRLLAGSSCSSPGPDPSEDSLSSSLGMRLHRNGSGAQLHNSLNSSSGRGGSDGASGLASSPASGSGCDPAKDLPKSRFFAAEGTFGSPSSSSGLLLKTNHEDRSLLAVAAATAGQQVDSSNCSTPKSAAGTPGARNGAPWSISLTDYAWGSGASAGSPGGAASGGDHGSSRQTVSRLGTAGEAEQDAASMLSSGWVPGRPEISSPNRGERLANLKRRQQEKRAATAVGSTRPDGTPDDGSSSYTSSPQASSSVHGIAGAAAAVPLLSWSARPLDSPGPGAAGSSVAPRGLHTAPADTSLAYKAAQPPGWSGGAQPGVQGYLRALSDPATPASPSPDPLRAGLRVVSADRDYGSPSPGPGSRLGAAGSGRAGVAYDDIPVGGGAGSMSGAAPLGLPASAPAGQYRNDSASGSGSPSPTKLWHGLRRKPTSSTSGQGVSSPSSTTRPGSVVDRATPSDEAQADLTPLKDPDSSARQVISKLQACNAAARKELDWQGQQDALTEARRLVAHHPEVIRSQLHEFVLAAAPAIDQLRSTTAKSSLLLFQELFVALGRGFDREVEEVVPLLLKKAAEVSTAGRDNFLAQEADRALSVLCECASEARCISVLLSHCGHKTPMARTRVAAHLDEMCSSNGCLAGLATSNWTLLERLVKAAAGFLEEGSLDTRTHAKRCLWAIRGAIPGRSDWERLLGAVAPEALQRKVLEVLDPAAGCPAFPANRGTTAAGARSPTRGRGTPVPGSPGPLGSPNSTGSRGLRTPEAFSTAAAAAGAGPGSPLRGVPGSSGSSSQQQGQLGSPMLVRGGSMVHSGSAGNGCASPVELASPSAGSLAARRRTSQQGSVRRRLSMAAGAGEEAGGSGTTGSSSALTAQGLGQSYTPQGGRSAGSSAPHSSANSATPELANAVEKVAAHMSSKEWRERCDALRAFVVLLPAVPALPDPLLQELVGALVPRLSDSNAKVNEQALETLAEALPVVADRINPALPSLGPALVTSLGSSNERVRAVAVQAFSALLGSCSMSGPAVPVLCHAALNSSSVKGKAAVVAYLANLAPTVFRGCPSHVVKHLLPTCGTLLMEPRGELRAPAMELLLRCAQLLGPGLSDAVGGCTLPVASKLREQLLLAGYGDM